MDIIMAVFILGVHALIGGAFLVTPVRENMKYAVPLFILNALASGPILYGMVRLGGYLNLMEGVIGPVLSLIPEVLAPVLKVLGPVIFWALIPVLPTLVFFLLLRLFAKRYSTLFRQKRLFGTLVCSSTVGLVLYLVFFFPDR